MWLSPVDPAKPLPVKFQEIAREGNVAIVRLSPRHLFGGALTTRTGWQDEDPHSGWPRFHPQEARHQRDQPDHDVSCHLSAG